MEGSIVKEFKVALDFEKKGYQLYDKVAASAKNPIVAKTFRYLAGQELVHMQEIEEFIRSKRISSRGDSLEDTGRFFSTTTKDFKDKLDVSDSELKAHDTAMALEKDAYNFYKGLLEKTDESELKDFFRFLMEQEDAHYELIQKAFEYLKDPVSFYTEDERWMADGG